MRTLLVEAGNKLAVNAYKLVGFVALLAIFVGITAYFATELFFLGSRSWAAPLILGPAHSEVIDLSSKVAAAQNARDALSAEITAIDAELEVVDATEAAYRGVQRDLVASMEADVRLLVAEDALLGKLLARFGRERGKIEARAQKYQEVSDELVEELYSSRMMTRDQYASIGYLTAQVSQSQFMYADAGATLTRERWRVQHSLEAMRDAIERLRGADASPGVGSTSAVSSSPGASGTLNEEPDASRSHEVVLLELEWVKASIEIRRAAASRKGLEAKRHVLEVGVGRHDEIIDTLEGSAYLRALRERIDVAFVPYENVANAKPGAIVFGCSLHLIWCRDVGRVKGVLPGEVVGARPFTNVQLRGVLTELDITDPAAAEYPLLHLGWRPLGF